MKDPPQAAARHTPQDAAPTRDPFRAGPPGGRCGCPRLLALRPDYSGTRGRRVRGLHARFNVERVSRLYVSLYARARTKCAVCNWHTWCVRGGCSG